MKTGYKIGGILCIFIMIAGVSSIYFKKNPWELYFENKLKEPPREFVVQALESIPPLGHSGGIALDLGASVGHETLLFLDKGYDVIAVDSQNSAFDIMLNRPEFQQHKDRLKTIVSSFEDLDFGLLPQADIVVASFSLPFCPPEKFDSFWTHLVQKIKPGGIFIGNTFDPGFTAFPPKDRAKMTFHTKEQSLGLFRDFKILSFKEIKTESTELGKFDHYYEIVGQKK